MRISDGENRSTVPEICKAPRLPHSVICMNRRIGKAVLTCRHVFRLPPGEIGPRHYIIAISAELVHMQNSVFDIFLPKPIYPGKIEMMLHSDEWRQACVRTGRMEAWESFNCHKRNGSRMNDNPFRKPLNYEL
eukprot:6020447-Pyramimonas_sp.AAC.1